MHILPISKYQQRKRLLRVPKIAALSLGLVTICYALWIVFVMEFITHTFFRKPNKPWYPMLYKKETREMFVKEWNGSPAKVAVPVECQWRAGGVVVLC